MCHSTLLNAVLGDITACLSTTIPQLFGRFDWGTNLEFSTDLLHFLRLCDLIVSPTDEQEWYVKRSPDT